MGRKRAHPRKGAPRPLAPLCALIWVSARQMTRGRGGSARARFLAQISRRDCMSHVNSSEYTQYTFV